MPENICTTWKKADNPKISYEEFINSKYRSGYEITSTTILKTDLQTGEAIEISVSVKSK